MEVDNHLFVEENCQGAIPSTSKKNQAVYPAHIWMGLNHASSVTPPQTPPQRGSHQSGTNYVWRLFKTIGPSKNPQ